MFLSLYLNQILTSTFFTNINLFFIQILGLKSMMELLEELNMRIIKDFLDVLILARLKKTGLPVSGYDVIRLIHREFNTLLSSGTVYTLLYSMERECLIRGVWRGRKRVYTLTEKGDENIKTILNADHKILGLVKKLLMKEE